MSAAALQFQANKYLGSTEPLKVYYDFANSSAFTAQSGSVHQAYLRNSFPANDTGLFHGKIVGASGANAGAAMTLATGAGGFLSGEAGNFTKNIVQISGSSGINLKDYSYLFLVDSEFSNDGVILGSFEKQTDVVGGDTIVSSKGFNLGVTSRGHLFFQSLGKDGEYCFVFNETELTPRTAIGLSFSNSSATVSRFDYLNEETESKSFSFDASDIKNSPNLYLGSSPTYWRGGPKLFSGKMEKFAAISGQVPASSLFEIGKGLFSEYTYSSGAVTTGQILSGYATSFVYKTGITGKYANITGYSGVRSGINPFINNIAFTGNIQVREGDRFYKSFGDYFEQQGFLSGIHVNTYNPTGESASGTLGLQAGVTNVSGYSISSSFPTSTVQIPLYQLINLTGVTNELSGIVNTPVYTNVLTTGNPTSGVTLSGNSERFNKNYLYFLGQR